MKASITVELIDKVTAKAKQISSALKDINTAAGNQAIEHAKAATAKVDAATKTAKQTAKEAVREAKKVAQEAAQAHAKEAAKAPTKQVVERAKEAAKPPIKAQPNPHVPERPALDYLRKTGDAAQAHAKEAAKAPTKQVVERAKEAAKPPIKAQPNPHVPERPALDYLRKTGDAPPPIGKDGGKRLGFADLGNLPQDADKAAGQTAGLLGNAVATARNKVAQVVSQELGTQLSTIATGYIAEKVQGALNPIRAELGNLREQFPALAPLIDNVSNHIEGLAGVASSALGEIGGRIAGVVAMRIGMLAAGLISLPGIAVMAVVAIMTRWSEVKDFMASLFAKLPAPVQAAMSRIGAVLSATPLGGGAARGFDALATTVQSAFNIITSDATDKWDQLKSLLLDNPLSAMSGAWDGLKSYMSNLFSEIAANPREALAGMAASVLNAFKAIPSQLANVGLSIIEAITGADLSRVKARVQEIINAFFDIPNNLISLGGEIAAKIAAGDFSDAARMAAESFANGLRNILTLISDIGGAIIDTFKDISLIDAGIAMIKSLWDGMRKGLDDLAGKVREKLQEIKNTITGSFGGTSGPATAGKIIGGSALGARAKGGPVAAGTPYMVGEEGQELFVPDTNGRIIDATQTRRMLSPVALPPSAPMPSIYGNDGGGGTTARATIEGDRSSTTSVTNTFQISMQAPPSVDDPEEFGRRMWAEIERRMRGMMYDGVSS